MRIPIPRRGRRRRPPPGRIAPRNRSARSCRWSSSAASSDGGGGGLRTRVTLTTRQLNRALLARQVLLKRKRVSVPTAIHAAGGLQSQEPRDPFVALWSRIRSFNARHLLDASRNREIVRGTFLPATIHPTTSAAHTAFRLPLRPRIHRDP